MLHKTARHGQSKAAIDQTVDADDPALGIGQGAAGVPRGESNIRLHPAWAGGYFSGPDSVNNTSRERAADAQRIADGEHQLADAQGVGITDDGRR